MISTDELAELLIEEFFEDSVSSELLREYKERSVVIGKRVLVLEHSGASYYADAVGITDGAGLLVSRDGVTREVFSGEISIKLEV